MQNIMDLIYGPLPKDYCNFFYIFSIIGFIYFILALISFTYLAVIKKRSVGFYLQSLYVLGAFFIFYFQNRLLHTMCVRSI